MSLLSLTFLCFLEMGRFQAIPASMILANVFSSTHVSIVPETTAIALKYGNLHHHSGNHLSPRAVRHTSDFLKWKSDSPSLRIAIEKLSVLTHGNEPSRSRESLDRAAPPAHGSFI
jgi:hypothetical protein